MRQNGSVVKDRTVSVSVCLRLIDHLQRGEGQPIYPQTCCTRQCEYHKTCGHSPAIPEPIMQAMSHIKMNPIVLDT